MPIARLILASASPRRAELLRQLGLEFERVRADIDETVRPGERPEDSVRRLARGKAEAVSQALSDARDAVVLGADTEVEIDAQLLGKPVDRVHAREMLKRLSGRSHRVLSAICVLGHGRRYEALSISEIRFAPLSEASIERYLDSGEGFDKAGGYAIQGRAAAFVEHLAGSYTGVVGLPLMETARALAAAGIDVLAATANEGPLR